MRCFIIVLMGLLTYCASAQSVSHSGIHLPSELAKMRAVSDVDSIILHHPMLQQGIKNQVTAPAPRHENKSFAFYFLLGLLLLLGGIRRADPRFFDRIKSGLNSSAQSGRPKSLDNATIFSFQQIMLNAFACISMGLFVWSMVYRQYISNDRWPQWMLVSLCILGVVAIYIFKFLFLRLTGWAMGLSKIFDIYITNVMLVNKVLGIVLLPFTALLLLTAESWATSLIAVALSLAFLLLMIRYIRSWNAFGSLVQFSKFHFFTYICASEILPVLVMMKLLQSGFHL